MEALSSHRLPALLGRITLTLVLLALIASLWGWSQGSEEPRGKLRLRFVDSGTGQVLITGSAFRGREPISIPS